MAEYHDYIGIFENAFSQEFCQNVIFQFEKMMDSSAHCFHSPSEGTDQFPNSALGRKDSSLFFEHVAPPVADSIHNGVIECLKQYMQEYVGLHGHALVSHTCKVQKTPPKGGFHVWHSEHAADLRSCRRSVVWILYLSTHENEGETEFLQQGIRVAPKAGTVVLWPAQYTHPHRGNPVYTEDKFKYIATGWFEKVPQNEIPTT